MVSLTEETVNQCDGCRRGLPTRSTEFGGAIHYNPDGSYDHIGCTAHLYKTMTIDIEKIITDEGLEPDEAAWLRTQPPEAAYLMSVNVAFIGTHHEHEWSREVKFEDNCKDKQHWPILCVNVNDTFAYACGDAEEVKPERLAEVVDIYKRFGPTGLVCWAAVQRNEDPVVEFTEDPEYQKTWKALYGELQVNPNEFNKVDPRWSNDKLNLQPWTPIP